MMTDDMWIEMLALGAATPATRQRRSNYGGYTASSFQVDHGIPLASPQVWEQMKQ